MFQEGQEPNPPYIIYYNPSEQHLNADNFLTLLWLKMWLLKFIQSLKIYH